MQGVYSSLGKTQTHHGCSSNKIGSDEVTGDLQGGDLKVTQRWRGALRVRGLCEQDAETPTNRAVWELPSCERMGEGDEARSGVRAS